MLFFRKILFPVDFSDHSRGTAPYIADLANRFRASLHLLHVVEGGWNTHKLWRQRELDLAGFAAHLPGGKYLPQSVAYGNPAQAIVRYAETHNIDVIAMPTRGNGMPGRWLLGSVTEAVLNRASCAVWTEAATGHPHTRWSPIVCATDLESGSDRVLSFASGLSEMFQANLIVVHAIPPVSESFRSRPSHVPSARSPTEAQRKLEAQLHRLDVSADPVIEAGSVENVIGLVAERRRAELLIIGRGNRKQPQGYLGIRSYELIRRAPCPVVSCVQRPLSTGCFWTEWQQDSTREMDFPLRLGNGLAG